MVAQKKDDNTGDTGGDGNAGIPKMELVAHDFSVTVDISKGLELIDVLAHVEGDNPELKAVSDATYGATSIEEGQSTLFQLPAVMQNIFKSLKVISVTETSLVGLMSYSFVQEITFEYEGQSYVVPFERYEYEDYVTLVKADSFKQSELVFDFEKNSRWLISWKFDSETDIAVPYQFNLDGTYEVLNKEALFGNSVVSDFLFDGTWRLSRDKKTLSLISEEFSINHVVGTLHLTRYHAEDESQSALAEFERSNGEQYITISEVVPLPKTTSISVIQETMEQELVFNSLLNRHRPIYFDEQDKYIPHNNEGAYSFYLNKIGVLYSGYCLVNGKPNFDIEFCGEPLSYDLLPISFWEYTSLDNLNEAFMFESFNGHRYWLPLNYSERGILTVLEWNLWSEEGNYFTHIIPARLNYYQVGEKPADSQIINSVKSKVATYKVVNPQSVPRPQQEEIKPSVRH